MRTDHPISIPAGGGGPAGRGTRVAALVLCGAGLALGPAGVFAQACSIPAGVLERVPPEVPTVEAYATLPVVGPDGVTTRLGIGQLSPSLESGYVELPPGAIDWLPLAGLPLSSEPGAEPFGWIANGWIVPNGAEPVPIRREALVETGYETDSFVVFEVESDWFRIRYGDGDDGTAWVPACAFEANGATLAYVPWSDWLLSDQISPLFFRADRPGTLRSGPSPDARAMADIGDDYALEPIETRGEWMRVRVKEPSDYCEFDLESSVREGWIRWFEAEVGPRVWYYTRGC